MAMLKAMLKYSFYDMKGTVNTKNSVYDMALVQRIPPAKNEILIKGSRLPREHVLGDALKEKQNGARKWFFT